MTGSYDDFFQPRPPTWTQRIEPRASEPPPEAGLHPRSGDEGQYRAFGFTPTEDLETCDVAWWLGHDTPQGQEVQYRFLVRIGYVGDEQINLMLTDAIISIEGKRLQELRKRLSRRRVTFIQAFNPKVWARPAEGEPIIERIGILYPGEARP